MIKYLKEYKIKYFQDLIQKLNGQINKPITPIDLPDLTTGPHYAYAFQWFIFAIVILVGRIIIGRKLYSKADRT